MIHRQSCMQMIHLVGRTCASPFGVSELRIRHIGRRRAFLGRSDDPVAIPDKRQAAMLVELLGSAWRIFDALHHCSETER